MTEMLSPDDVRLQPPGPPEAEIAAKTRTLVVGPYLAGNAAVQASGRADILLHVRDISHADAAAQAEDVGQVLNELGIRSHADRIIEVWNKADLLNEDERTRLLNLSTRGDMAARHDRDSAAPVLVSAVTGEGLPALTSRIEARIARTQPLDLCGGAAAGGRSTSALAARKHRGARPARGGERHIAPRGSDGTREGATLPQPLSWCPPPPTNRIIPVREQ